jgi:oxygen-independent coproporphyrinogen-3 oxidase
MPSIYLHIPFCVKKCAYCDFTSYANREADLDAYVSALIEEMRVAASAYGNFPVETVFFGGGTPSLLSPKQLCALMEALCARFSLRLGAEITMEANPGTVTPENLAAYRRAGVNRLSIGVQSFDAALLRRVGRIHTSADAEAAVSMARAAGFENISMDLIYSLPGQTIESFMGDVRRARALGASHLSLYALILEPGTPLYAQNPQLPDEEVILAMRREAQALLAPEFIRYEISNYAKRGMECRHNLVYWTRGDYLGLGCAAHSLMRGERFQNADSLSDYLRGIGVVRREKVTKEDAREETIMLSTRTRAGIDLDAFRARFGDDLRKSKAADIARLVSLGLVEISGGFLRLTDAGYDVHNAVVLALVDA